MFHSRFRLPAFTVAVLAGAALLVPVGASSLTLPGTVVKIPGINKVVPLARQELSRNVMERRSNNVPRYHRGKGRIAPYSIGDAWCAAFSTWVWSQSGFTDYLGAGLVWPSNDGTDVAVQVTDLTRWAKKTGHFSFRARAGFLVAYGGTHIGIVQKVDRDGRAVKSIEGNLGNRVQAVNVNMEDVTGYISPIKLMAGQYVRESSVRADVD